MTNVRHQDVPGNWLFSSSVLENEEILNYKFRLLLTINFVTALVMWMYVFIASFFVAGSTEGYIGFVCSVLHVFSPLIYRWTRSMPLAAYNVVATGFVFQTTFAYRTGGFYSPTLIWVAVLPLIVGILTSKAHAILWTMISASAVVVMFYLQQANLIPPDQLLESGRATVQFMIALGLIILVGGFTLFFIELGYFFYNNRFQAKSPVDP
ncbi:hypothetical protein [Bdellovibrio sp. NC01]|uniref:hypothetical protein n=1 Tax=Bdellovibrio sp. NC01 TaxID=2220073 RepID=UPI00115B3037|nr:hypothetical protein [Bdellovibrio sp. NC01]QDK36826.1 hypothetical protein DOE51_04055 [Bdellovibrio sp. NC01]